MCNNTSLLAPSFEPPGSLLELLNGVKGTAGLEGANALEVLALEPQPHDGLGRGPVAGPFGAIELGGGPRGGCQAGDGRVG